MEACYTACFKFCLAIHFTNLSAELNHAQNLKNETSYHLLRICSVPGPYMVRTYRYGESTEKARGK